MVWAGIGDACCAGYTRSHCTCRNEATSILRNLLLYRSVKVEVRLNLCTLLLLQLSLVLLGVLGQWITTSTREIAATAIAHLANSSFLCVSSHCRTWSRAVTTYHGLSLESLTRRNHAEKRLLLLWVAVDIVGRRWRRRSKNIFSQWLERLWEL